MADHDETGIALLATQYAPDFGCAFQQCANRFHEKFKPTDAVILQGGGFLFKWTGDKKLVGIGPTIVSVETLGIDTWRKNLDQFIEQVVWMHELLKVTELKRIGFRVFGMMHQSMSHEELCDLFFGSVLNPAEEYHGICEAPTDPNVHLEGTFEDMKLRLDFCAVSVEQMFTLLPTIPNIEQFAKRKFKDPVVGTFQDRMTSGPGIWTDIDLYKTEVKITDIAQFVKASITASDMIVTGIVKKLLSKA